MLKNPCRDCSLLENKKPFSPIYNASHWLWFPKINQKDSQLCCGILKSWTWSHPLNNIYSIKKWFQRKDILLDRFAAGQGSHSDLLHHWSYLSLEGLSRHIPWAEPEAKRGSLRDEERGSNPAGNEKGKFTAGRLWSKKKYVWSLRPPN